MKPSQQQIEHHKRIKIIVFGEVRDNYVEP